MRPPDSPSPDLVVNLRRMWLPVAGVVLLLAGCSGGGSPSAPPPGPPPQPAAKQEAPPPAPAPAPPPYVYEGKGRRDPFRPLIAPRVVEAKARPKTGLAALEVNDLKLSGILWERQGLYALVEAPNGAGYVLRVNDIIGENARVAKITPEGVTFEVRGVTIASQVQARVVELLLRKEE